MKTPADKPSVPFTSLLIVIVSVALLALTARAQVAGSQTLRGHHALPAAARAQAVDRLAPTQLLQFTIGLPLRNEAELTQFLQELSDPSSPNYRKFLTPEQFTGRFGPTEADYQALLDYARASGFTVTATHPNRVLVSLSASVADVERAFHVNMRHYKHPTEARNFFAPDAEPTLDLTVPIQDIGGLDDFVIPHANYHPRPAAATPQNGSAWGGGYMGADFRRAYAPDVSLTGAGQSVGTINFAGYFQSDVRAYQDTNGIPHIPIVEELLDGVGNITNNADGETVLDLEMISSMSPGINSMYFYRGTTIDTMLSAIASDDVAKQIGASWTYGITGNTPGLLQQLAAEGITYFTAAGDYDAYPAPGHLTVPDCAGNPYVTCVGGTTLTMNGNGVSYASEKVWNWSGTGGTGGGISSTYSIPFWQQGITMTANQGSTTMRNIPDVALTGDNVYVYDSTSGTNTIVGGTSCATPLWAAFTALINQQNVSLGNPTIGAFNPLVYAIGKNSAYSAAFHDITVGSNTNSVSLTNYPAAPGYDLCTGWGTPKGQATINAFTTMPYLASVPPAMLTAYTGSNISLTVSAGGQPTLAYQWQYDGNNISGATSATLNLSNLQPTNSGLYRVIVTNNFGAVTSTACALSVIASPPYPNQALATGPVAYWRLNETSGTTAYDSAGGFNGTNNGSLVLGVSGPAAPAFPGFESGNTAYQFSGSGTSISLPPLNLSSNVTLTAWVMPNAAQGYFPGVVSWNNGAGIIISLGFNNNNNQLTYMRNGFVYSSSSQVVPTNQWTFIALALSPTNAVLYMATNSSLSAYNTGTVNPALTSFTDTAYIGYNPNYGRYNGSIDEVAIYNQLLRPSQITNLVSASQIALPVVTLTTPANGSAFLDNTSINLSASVTTNGHSIAKVRFYNGATLLGESSTAPYQYTWTGLTPGTYTLLAQAIYDGSSSIGSLPANVTVNYRPPLLTNDSAATGQNTPVTIPVLANDSDLYALPLSIQSITQPARGSAAIAGTNVIYTPNNYWYGLDTFSYTAGDGTGSAATAAVSVTTTFPNYASVFTNAALAAGPVAYWRLNETSGTTAHDSVGGYNGTNNGSLALGVGGPTPPAWPGFEPANTAYQFNGTNTSVSLPALNLNTNTITITAWVYCNGTQGNYPGVFSWNTTVGLLFGNANNKLAYLQNGLIYTSTLVVPTNQWTLVALVVTATNTTIYMATNSTLASYNINTATAAAAFNTASYLGKSPYGQFNGAMDEVAVFNQSLAPAQISGLLLASQTGLPAVALTAPANGSVFNAASNITLTASVTTNGYHTVEKVQFYNGAALLGESTASPYQFIWSGAPAGTNSLTAKLLYDGGGVLNSSPAAVTITNAVSISTTPTNIVAIVNGYSLVLKWPADHISWTLQAQTNPPSAGLGTNWVDVQGSTSVNTVTNIINPANGAVFYRLKYTP